VSALPRYPSARWLGALGLWFLSARLAFAGVPTAVVAVVPARASSSGPTPGEVVADNLLKNVAQVTSRLVDDVAGLETALPIEGPADGSRYWSAEVGWSVDRILQTCAEGGAQQVLLLTMQTVAPSTGDPGGYTLELRRVHEGGIRDDLGSVRIPLIPPNATGISREDYEKLQTELASLVELAAEAPALIDVQCTDSLTGQHIDCVCDLDGVGNTSGPRCSFRAISGSYNLIVGGDDKHTPTTRHFDISEGAALNLVVPLDPMASLTVKASPSAHVWVDGVAALPLEAIPVRPYAVHRVEVQKGQRDGVVNVSLQPGEQKVLKVSTRAAP